MINKIIVKLKAIIAKIKNNETIFINKEINLNLSEKQLSFIIKLLKKLEFKLIETEKGEEKEEIQFLKSFSLHLNLIKIILIILLISYVVYINI